MPADAVIREAYLNCFPLDEIMLPEKKREKTRFVMTPLVDVIFLLLVFFMLSSQIETFSFLKFGPPEEGASRVDEGGGPAAGERAGKAGQTIVLQVFNGHLRARNELISLEDLPDTIPKFIEDNVTEVVLIATYSARVQDIVTTLEQFKQGGLTRVRLLSYSAERGSAQ